MQTTNYKGFVITLSEADTKKLDKAWDGAKKHWTCIVYDKPNRKQMSFDIFGGSMATMSPLEALYCFCSDAWDYINLDDVSDLCNEFGYDYPVGEQIYKKLEKTYFKCRKFIGSENDILEIINELSEKFG